MSTNISYLPEIGTEDWGAFKAWYLLAQDVELEEVAKKLGYTNRDGMTDAMRKRGVRRERATSLPNLAEREIPVVNLPPVKLMPFKERRKGKGDEEMALLLTSCGHAGKITKSFNKEVYRKRMGNIFQSVMTLVNLHRNMYPIRKLIIANVGDNNQGENPHQGSVIGDVEMGARDQVKKLSAPMWNDLIGSFKQHFEEVDFEGIGGNHGHDKLAPTTSSYDLLLYDILEAGIGQQKGINIHTHEEWATIFNILGFKFFAFHGDGIPCQAGVPFFALDKKLKSWYMQYGGFNYALGGHFHKRHFDEISSKLEYFMAASLVTDDEWALKKLGISSNPSAWLLGVHPRHGVTWRYALVVDFDFLPVKVEV